MRGPLIPPKHLPGSAPGNPENLTGPGQVTNLKYPGTQHLSKSRGHGPGPGFVPKSFTISEVQQAPILCGKICARAPYRSTCDFRFSRRSSSCSSWLGRQTTSNIYFQPFSTLQVLHPSTHPCHAAHAPPRLRTGQHTHIHSALLLGPRPAGQRPGTPAPLTRLSAARAPTYGTRATPLFFDTGPAPRTTRMPPKHGTPPSTRAQRPRRDSDAASAAPQSAL
jgi:hypothetical protein